MMRLRLAFTRPAKLDLDELIAHIGEDNPVAAVTARDADHGPDPGPS